MKKEIALYIYAYKESNINIFIKPLNRYLYSKDMTLGDIDYYMTTYNKDKSINKSDLEKLLNNIENIDELILIKNIYPLKQELDKIKEYCKTHSCKIITISKYGELLGVIK
ncbi:MAG: hypothetical protein WDA12_04090 [Bacilli bacterium]